MLRFGEIKAEDLKVHFLYLQTVQSQIVCYWHLSIHYITKIIIIICYFTAELDLHLCSFLNPNCA